MALGETIHPSCDPDLTDVRASSPTAHLLDALQLHGYRPSQGEPDPRPLPDHGTARGLLYDSFDALVAMLADTRLEDDLPDLLWSMVNVFHRRLDRIERDLDDNEQAQRRSQAEQDFSEVRSVELERLTEQGRALIARRDAFEELREDACRHYAALVGAPWQPRTGSLVARATLTSAVIDSRAFLNARRRADLEVLVPKGTRVALTGGPAFNDHSLIWAKLDQVRAKYPDLVLLHGGAPKGAEHIAALWARPRQVPQVVFKPDWAKHRNAAPFKRNDALLDALPIGVMAFPGNGISENLADKARKLGIPVMRFRAGDT